MEKPRILIVEDEPDIALIMKLQLEDAGYSITRVRNGNEALDILNTNIFDLTLLDYKMPGPDGLEVLRRIKSSSSSRMPIIMLTAHGSEDVAVECLKRGAHDYISKPFNTEDMIRAVAAALACKEPLHLHLQAHHRKVMSASSAILIVDDEPDIAYLLKLQLSQAGYVTECARDGVEALERLTTRKFDAILLDLNMPRMDGLEVLERVVKSLVDTPVIIMTAHGSEDIAAKCIKLGAMDYLSKPFETDNMLTKVASIFQGEVAGNLDIAEFVAVGIFDGKFRIVSLAPDGTYSFIDPVKKVHDILYVVDPETLEMERAIEELEDLMNSRNAKEHDFQIFFEKYPNLILNDAYKKAHSHVVLSKDDGSSLVPDFVLEPILDQKLCDILELKLPTAPIFVGKTNRRRHSSAVYEACAQLREYNAYFDEEANRQKVIQRYGLCGYRPQMFVIIGRRGNVDPLEARRIQLDTPQMHLATYDDVIERMKYKLQKRRKNLSDVEK